MQSLRPVRRVAELGSLGIVTPMSIRDIFCTNTRSAVLLRGVIAMSVGVVLAAVVTATTDTNAFRRFAFPIFVIPTLLTLLNLLTRRGERAEHDRRNDA